MQILYDDRQGVFRAGTQAERGGSIVVYPFHLPDNAVCLFPLDAVPLKLFLTFWCGKKLLE